jgi:exopolyphosphatase / guanosine-5'-triphosphate,3'-diphosphate pyrophosphatase
MQAAVVDIGSNSVRLVIYDCQGQHLQAIFNEKVTCCLGEGVTVGSALREDRKEIVRRTIRRFAQIIAIRCPDIVKILATAAIRESSDGKAFSKELSAILRHPVHILSGEEEATYAARGVRSAAWQPEGLVIDMGGGSTDVSQIYADGEVQAECSIPVGVLTFSDYYQQHGYDEYIKYLKHVLTPITVLEVQRVYAVGGSFRAVARFHMDRINYPLHIIHDYCLTLMQLQQLLQEVKVEMTKEGKLQGVPRRRHASLLPALILLIRVMEMSHITECVFSAAGIREGALSLLMPVSHSYDPLLAMMQAIPTIPADGQYMEDLSHWIISVLPCQSEEARLVNAFCHVSEIAATVHPDYRAEYAFERIVSTQCYGVTHIQQVTLALALYHRYRAKLKLKHPTLALLSSEHKAFSYALGQLADLAYSLSAGCSELLRQYQLQRDHFSGKITVTSIQSSDAIIPESIEHQLDGLSEAIHLLTLRTI